MPSFETAADISLCAPFLEAQDSPLANAAPDKAITEVIATTVIKLVFMRVLSVVINSIERRVILRRSPSLSIKADNYDPILLVTFRWIKPQPHRRASGHQPSLGCLSVYEFSGTPTFPSIGAAAVPALLTCGGGVGR